MPEARTQETVRREIQAERERLAMAVADLRAQVSGATNVNARLRAHSRVLAPAALAGGFVLGGGIGASMRLLARRSREH